MGDDPNERVSIDLDPVEALRALLKVDPNAPPAELVERAEKPPPAPKRPEE